MNWTVQNSDVSNVYIAPTFHCINRCLNCPLSNHSDSTSIERVVDRLTYFVSKMKLEPQKIPIEISGGEPFLWSDIDHLIQNILQMGFRPITFATTSQTMTSSTVERLQTIFKMASASPVFFVTLYSHHSQVHNGIAMRPNSWQSRIRGIRLLLERGFNVHLKFLLMRPTVEGLLDSVEFVHSEFGCPGVSVGFYGVDYSGRALSYMDTIGIKYTDALPKVEQAIDRCESYGLPVSINTIPLCLVDPFYWKYLAAQEITDGNTLLITPTGVDFLSQFDSVIHTDACASCVVQNTCPRMWNSYAQVFGTSEISAIKA